MNATTADIAIEVPLNAQLSQQMEDDSMNVATRLYQLTRQSTILMNNLSAERENVFALMQTVSSSDNRFFCCVCQANVPLSMLVLNDACRHSVCRVCFAKVTLHTYPYECLLCKRSPGMLATLSPGTVTTEAKHNKNATTGENDRNDGARGSAVTLVGYRLHFMENDSI